MKRKLPLHQAVQKHILTFVPGQMEYSMPGHIADVAWLEKRIVFEVQCSPLPLHEAKRREADYQKLGFSIVWILHQSLFNRRTLTSTELYLRMKTCYYTNIVLSGQGMIYDQFEVLKGKWRKRRSLPFPINLAQPVKKDGRVYFSGDTFSQPKHARETFEAKQSRSWYDRQLTKLLCKLCK